LKNGWYWWPVHWRTTDQQRSGERLDSESCNETVIPARLVEWKAIQWIT
jgi:hypothetical protein